MAPAERLRSGTADEPGPVITLPSPVEVGLLTVETGIVMVQGGVVTVERAVPQVVEGPPQPAHLARARPAAWTATSTGLRMAVKALFDRLVGAVLLVLLLPVMLVVGVIIRLDSPGRAIYRQERVGRDGRTFRMAKFRTMALDAERQQPELADGNQADGLLFKLHDDPRVTSVGRFLRRSSLDELPQLWNIVRGEMSLVGPRPLPVRPEDFAGAARRRLAMRPGLTGLAQVNGRSELSWSDTVHLDVAYVDGWSLWLDLRLLARTPLVVLQGRGAY
jgi:lipopolysaccharide/colanic/teichoic acid biosynthesis glycosyltransferase